MPGLVPTPRRAQPTHAPLTRPRGEQTLLSAPPAPPAATPHGKMHELSIMTEALEQAEAAARRENATRIHRIRVRIGALSGVVAESLEFAFETLRPGTMAEDARLDIERIPATFHCASCSSDITLDDVEFACPACAGPLTLKGGGREMEIADMEVS